MSVDTIIWTVIILGAAYAAWKFWPSADVNKDGKVDGADVKEVVKQVADVNKDGQVNTDDVKAVATKVKKTATKTASKVKEKTTRKTK